MNTIIERPRVEFDWQNPLNQSSTDSPPWLPETTHFHNTTSNRTVMIWNFQKQMIQRNDIDRESQRLFMLNLSNTCYGKKRQYAELIMNSAVVDLESKKVRRYANKVPTWGSMQCSCHRLERLKGCKMLKINGQVHNLGVQSPTEHVMWSEMQNKWEPIKMLPAFSWEFKGVRGTALVHVPSKNMVLMIGGKARGTGKWGGKWVGLWKYDITTGQWSKIEIDGFHFVNVHNHQTVLTSDEDFVIMYVSSALNPLHVLDIRDDQNIKHLEISLKIPPEIKCGSLVGGGGRSHFKLIIMGWIRRKNNSHKTNESISHMIPLEIVMLIADWYSKEMIHWMNRWKDNAYHRMIALNDILCSKEI